MSLVPNDLKFTENHEWVLLEENGVARVGITDHAQAMLGDLVFIELPEEGTTLAFGEECAVVESVKAASDVYSPLSGEVIANNPALEETPETINTDPYHEGWIFKLQLADTSELDNLLDAAAYTALCAQEDD